MAFIQLILIIFKIEYNLSENMESQGKVNSVPTVYFLARVAQQFKEVKV